MSFRVERWQYLMPSSSQDYSVFWKLFPWLAGQNWACLSWCKRDETKNHALAKFLTLLMGGLCFTFCHRSRVQKENEVVQINTVPQTLPYLPFLCFFFIFSSIHFIHLVTKSSCSVHSNVYKYNQYLIK